jgi:mono/diheme cytochrome c family protein
MKRIAFVMAVVAVAGCAKGEQKPAAAAGDTSSMMAMSDTSHGMASDTSHMMMSDSSHMMMADSSKMRMGSPKGLNSDSTTAEMGASLYKDKGCAACHNIAKSGGRVHRQPGGKQSGPDLAGVTERRDRDWLRRFLKDPDAMLATDTTAMRMMAKAKDLKMPNMHLSDNQIEALINYLAVKQH